MKAIIKIEIEDVDDPEDYDLDDLKETLKDFFDSEYGDITVESVQAD